MRLLILYPFLVKAGSLGGVARVTRLIEYLDRRGHDVWLACFATDRELASNPPIEGVRSHCREMVVLPTEPRSGLRRAWSLLFGANPAFVEHFSSDAMHSAVRRILAEESIDVFHVEFTYMGDYVGEASGKDCGTVLVDEELNFHAGMRLFKTAPLSLRGLRALWESRKFKRYELGVVERFDKVLAIVDGERELLLAENPALDVGLYPNTVDTNFFEPRAAQAAGDGQTDQGRIVFVGNFEHYPNEDGILWFARSILPRIRESAPGVRVDIIGANVTPAVRALDDGDGVRVLGYVDDLRDYLAQASAFVCPLINGGGMRGKALEAMSMSVPVVSTSIGIEGIAARNGVDALIADDASEFASAVLRLLGDARFREDMGAAGRTLVRERYDDAVVFAQLEAEYERLAARAHSRGATTAAAGQDHNSVSAAGAAGVRSAGRA